MVVDPDTLARQVLLEIETYQIPPRHPEHVGSSLPPEWFATGLIEMRRCLVTPYALEVSDYEPKSRATSLRTVMIVADDNASTLLAFDPNSEGDFVLVWRKSDRFAISHIRGDAVGCFLAI